MSILLLSSTLLVGQDFWYHLTGDECFYESLINTYSEVADEINAKEALDELIETTAEIIDKNGLSLF